jgi:hypothetical protein
MVIIIITTIIIIIIITIITIIDWKEDRVVEACATCREMKYIQNFCGET